MPPLNSYTIKALLPLVIPISLLTTIGIIENINQPKIEITHFVQALIIFGCILIILKFPRLGGIILLILVSIATAGLFFSQQYNNTLIFFIYIVFLLPTMVTGVLLILPPHINFNKKIKPYHNQKNI